MPQGLVPFLKASDIHHLVCDLALKLNKEYGGKQLVLICPLRGAVFFLSDLVRQLSGDVWLDFVYLENNKGHLQIKKDISLDLRDRHVVIVDVVAHSGLSLAFLKKRVELCQPASCKILVLFDKPAYRQAFVGIDYAGTGD